MTALRPDLSIIAANIDHGARLLDIAAVMAI